MTTMPPPPAPAPAPAPPAPPSPAAIWVPPARRPSASLATRVDRPGRLLLLSLAAGLALDIGIRGGPANAMVALGLVIGLSLLLLDATLSRASRATVLAAGVPSVFLAIRASEWVTTLNLAAVIGLVTVAVIYSASGSPFDAAVRHAVGRVFTSLGRGLVRLVPFAKSVPRPKSDTARTTARAVRAVLLVLPLLVALVLLLAASDAVFAGLISPNLDIGPLFGHVVLALVMAAPILIGALAVGNKPEERERHGRNGVLETNLILGLAAVVLGLFVASQLVALTGAGQRLIDEAGLTPAEYARSGFFQLCWASVVLIGYLAAVRFLAAADVMTTRSVRVLSALVPALALGLVAVSLRRMALYDVAFGMTMLRLSVVAGTCWIGAVLVMMALRSAGVVASRSWVPGGAVVAAFLVVIVANVANPEAFVVGHNVARAAQGADVDAGYLAELSDDAVPAIADAARNATDPLLANRLRDVIDCAPASHGATALNIAVQRADRIRAARCQS